ncbi:MAG: YbaY family lipoprotein [Ferrimonas sp.]
MKYLCAFGLALLLGGCSGGNESHDMIQDQMLSGEVSYRERIITPPGSTLIVSVVDDNGRVLGQQTQEVQGGPPFPYVVDYASGHDIMVEASLTFAGEKEPRFSLSTTPDQVAELQLRSFQQP